MENDNKRIRIIDVAKMANVSTGTVDRILHQRGKVSEESQKRVEEILKKLNYRPNRFASILAYNKRFLFVCFFPLHKRDEYWDTVEKGVTQAISDFSDYNIDLKIIYYDPFNYKSFETKTSEVVDCKPNGVILTPTTEELTRNITDELKKSCIPYIFTDSFYPSNLPLAFYGQNPQKSGAFTAKLSMLLNKQNSPIVIFKIVQKGIIGSNQQKWRQIGFENYMKEHHPNIKLYELDLHATDPDEDHYLLESFFKKYPEVNSGVLFNSKVFIVAEYLKMKKMDNFKIIGYDLLERNIEMLKQHYVDMIIAQRPKLQGYSAIRALADFLIFNKKPKTINYMPIDLITEENLDFYNFMFI